MSFSQDIKSEILNDKNTKKCCREIQRLAELLTEGTDINISDLKKYIKNNSCCKKAFLKGLFLGSGCIVDPNTDYHFEITTKSKKNATIILDIINKQIGFEAKLLKRSTHLYVIYIKESEQISMILSYLGAGKALFNYENIRVEKSIKNNINRSINCETANLTKTISAAYKQLIAIEKLEKNNMIEKLPNELQEICKLRKENPEMSLGDLTNLCSSKISKSGVNHRLNKIIEISKKI